MEEGNIFAVTPMSQILELNPGEIYSGYITVINPADAVQDFNYKVYVAPYSVMSEEYDVDVVTMTNRTQLANWVKIAEPNGTLAPNESARIYYTIEVPENAPAGGQYAAIIVGVDNGGEIRNDVTVMNTMEIASALYAKIAGETIHKGAVLENNVPGFSTTAFVVVSALMDNDGNSHEEAEISIKVTNAFTNEIILPSDEDDGIHTEIIMPETKKYVSKIIGDLPLLGVVKVKQSIYYNYTMSVVEKDVVICPIWFLALVILTAGAIIAGIASALWRHKRNRQIVENFGFLLYN